MLDAASALIGQVKAAVGTFQLSAALRGIRDLVGATNRYIVAREPWRLAKDESRRAELETSL